jgi:hypothetical protein
MATSQDPEAMIFPQDPEAVIFDALADTVSDGNLKWISAARVAHADEFHTSAASQVAAPWDVEASDALRGVVNHVVASLRRHGYEISRRSELENPRARFHKNSARSKSSRPAKRLS